MKEEAMPAQTGDVPVDGFRTYFQISGDLSVRHSSNRFHDDFGIQVTPLLPIGLTECLGAEAAFAGIARKPLDTVWIDLSSEVANLFEWPWVSGNPVIWAFGVGTEGRSPGFSCCFCMFHV